MQVPARKCVYQLPSLAIQASVRITSDRVFPELIAAEDTCGHQRDRHTPTSSPPHPATDAFDDRLPVPSATTPLEYLCPHRPALVLLPRAGPLIINANKFYLHYGQKKL